MSTHRLVPLSTISQSIMINSPSLPLRPPSFYFNFYFYLFFHHDHPPSSFIFPSFLHFFFYFFFFQPDFLHLHFFIFINYDYTSSPIPSPFLHHLCIILIFPFSFLSEFCPFMFTFTIRDIIRKNIEHIPHICYFSPHTICS